MADHPGVPARLNLIFLVFKLNGERRENKSAEEKN
jgi:hypothetical protein